MIYLDHAATTSVCPRAVAEMKKCLEIYYGNPSGAYEFAQQCKEKIETARKQVAKSINASKDEIYFTSGGTESDNWALFGTVIACRYKGKRGRHIITSCIEHHAILNSCKALEKQGYRVTYLPVDERGVISLRDLERAIRNDTIFILFYHLPPIYSYVACSVSKICSRSGCAIYLTSSIAASIISVISG